MNTCKITTDDTLRETAPHGSGSYPFAYYLEDIWQFDFHCIDWHWHHELEFLTVVEGTALCLLGKDKIELPKGYGLFVNSGVLHRYEAQSTALIPNVVFSPSLLAAEQSLIYQKYIQPVVSSAVGYQILDPQVGWQNQVLRLLETVYDLQSNKRQELLCVQSLLQMWSILSEHIDLTSRVMDTHRSTHKQARLQIMMQYIHDHYRDAISLKEIASSASISTSGALHFFQSYIQIPPVSYLIQYRLAKAAELLHTTEKSVSSIAEETGFASASYFCRKFKGRYRMSPGRYRAQRFELSSGAGS